MNQNEDGSPHEQLVEQLYDPQTRRIARQKLVRVRAVQPLLGCLDSTNESVVWAAVQSLGELHAVEAVGPMLVLLERGRLTVDVCQALGRITGQNFGADLARWRQWMQSSDTARRPQLDPLECVRQTGQYLGVEPTGSDKTYVFKLSLPEGRVQKVSVFFGREGAAGEDLVVIYSVCGPADAKHYEAVLRKNMTIPAGAFAIRDIGGQPNLVMVDTMLAETVTPSSLARQIEHIGSRADMVEQSLTKEDRR